MMDNANTHTSIQGLLELLQPHSSSSLLSNEHIYQTIVRQYYVRHFVHMHVCGPCTLKLYRIHNVLLNLLPLYHSNHANFSEVSHLGY